MKTRFILTAISLLFICFPHLSEAANAKYVNPKYNGYSLDWCKTFANSCGKPAADAFCRDKGHLYALKFAKKNKMKVKTMCVGDHAVCDPRHHGCDSFSFIICKRKFILRQ